MSNKDFYMESSDGFTIKKSHDNISMTLTAEFSRFDNIFVALSLLEDFKKRLIIYHECKSIAKYPISGKNIPFTLDIPDSLINRLTVRAESEKCSLDTLCVYIFSTFLSYGLKQNNNTSPINLIISQCFRKENSK